MSFDQFQQALADGRSMEDITLKHFNNDPRELRKQLRDWGITMGEAIELAKAKAKEVEITKEKYLQRRLAGEGRSTIMRSLGLSTTVFYRQLREWGIQEPDAEDRELELMVPVEPAKGIDQRVAEQLEQKAEARENASAEQKETGDEILQRVEQRAADQEKELANLRAASALWEAERARKDERIKQLEDTLSMMKRSAAYGVKGNDVSLSIPIPSVAIANAERTRIYAAVEALSDGVEAADIDRERVMSELFDLLQRTVNFITADLAELHPGKNVAGYVREFFAYYNNRHMEIVTAQQEAG
ncbi:hypothetical protein [Xylanibacillus composti]|nr:hypothetical protein [Xylanibacillus composti]